MLVVVGIIAMLVALIFPALKDVKEASGETQCASNLHQVGVAMMSYIAVYENYLPQVKVQIDPGPPAVEAVIGALFGGKKGQLPAYDINVLGADRRPLNKFLAGASGFGPDDPVPVFQCPLDRGQPLSPFAPTDHMYDFIGTSYNLNDHALDSETCATLVPLQTANKPGGRMPRVDDASKTWMCGDVPIYNYQDDNQNGVDDDDRGQRWHYGECRVNLCFVDGHVGQGIEVKPGIHNTTREYTFLPSQNWVCNPWDPQNPVYATP